MNLSDEYDKRLKGNAAMTPFMPVLRKLAAQCSSIVEFGVRRGDSTIALLRGLADGGTGILQSWDIEPPRFSVPILPHGIEWEFYQEPSERAEIGKCDLLLHDSLHTYDQVKKDLAKHGSAIRKWLIFHDSIVHASFGESENLHKKVLKLASQPSTLERMTQLQICEELFGRGTGLRMAIDEFMIEDSGYWAIRAHYPATSGLLVLENME